MGRCLPGCPRTPGRISWPAGRRPSAPCSPTRFQVSRDGFEQFLTLQRWLAAIFGATPFGHADHVIAALAGAMPGQGGALALSPATCLGTACCACRIPNWTCRWTRSGRMTRGRRLVCASPGWPRARWSRLRPRARETMLRWLPRKLAQLPDLRGLPTAVLHDAYMHCSYALAADKHDIKREINRLLRQRLLADGLDDMRAHPPRRARPLMLVVLEASRRRIPCIARIRRPCGARPLRAARGGDVRGRRCGRATVVSIVATACRRRMRWRRPWRWRANSGQTSSITQASACRRWRSC